MYPPTLWGPPLWHALFACAWHCGAEDVGAMRDLLFVQIPLLLPCAKCRDHFASKRGLVTRRTKGSEPSTADEFFKWLYYLKDEVNKTLGRRSLTLDEVTERYALHHGAVDDVTLGDALVLVAMGAHDTKRDDLFVDCCHAFASLLPLPDDSQLRRALGSMQKPVVPNAVRAAKAARVERGLQVLTHTHYRAFASETHGTKRSSPPKRRRFAD